MSELRRYSVWPFVLIVGCLFVLSAQAPRSWRSLTGSGAALTAVSTRLSSRSSRPALMPRESVSIVASATDLQTRLTAERLSSTNDLETGDEAEGDVQPATLTMIADFTVERQEAHVAPPVAERIDLDPSVADVSPLPSRTEIPAGGPTERVDPAETATPDGGSFPTKLPLEKSEEIVQETVAGWPYPAALIEQLQQVQGDKACRDWAQKTIAVLQRLHRRPSLTDLESGKDLSDLRIQVSKAGVLADGMQSLELRSQLLRAQYAVVRRLALWEHVHGLATQVSVSEIPTPDPRGLLPFIETANARLRTVRNGESWREYFLLDQLRDAAAGATDATHRRLLAREVLYRLESPQLSSLQQKFFTGVPFGSLELELRRWATEPVDYQRLLHSVERHERSKRSTDTRELAGYYHAVRWSTGKSATELSEHLNTHYRNANIRIAIADRLINRLLPSLPPMEEDVRDSILGARVFGRSRTMTQLNVVLSPDSQRWRMGLEAQGRITSRTSSAKGPARFFNDGLSFYRARKNVVLDERGFHVFGAEAEAESHSDLLGVETDFDDVPLLGSFARAYAVQQHDSQQDDARWEVEDRVRLLARSRLDEAVERELRRAEDFLENKLLQPLRTLQLDPTPVEMQTTDQRLIARYRLASIHQMAASTPRPQAPGDSLFSVQVHESAINNTLEQLQLEGRRLTLAELHKEIGTIIGRPDRPLPEDLPESVTVQFADEEAVRVFLAQGHAELRIRLAELSDGERHRWRNFEVHAFYRPEVDTLAANLVRDGVIHLGGSGLGFRDRIPLRGIFSKVLSRSRDLHLLGPNAVDHPALADVRVSQLVIEDGWLGMALGPR